MPTWVAYFPGQPSMGEGIQALYQCGILVLKHLFSSGNIVNWLQQRAMVTIVRCLNSMNVCQTTQWHPYLLLEKDCSNACEELGDIQRYGSSW